MSHDERNFELISALVDGELTPDEQARAEQLLTTSVELRRYRDELLALRSSIDKFPRYQLPPTFAQQVLRRAEREILVQGDQTPVSQRADAPLPSSAGQSRRISTWIAVTLAGLAAAIALMVVLQQLNHTPDVAIPKNGTPKQNQDDANNGLVINENTSPQDQQPQNSDNASSLAENQSGATRRNQNTDLVSGDTTNGDTTNGDTSNGDMTDGRAGNSDATASENGSSTDLAESPVQPRDSHDNAAAAEMQMPMFAWLCEVVLTSQGIEENTFQQALVRNGIDVQHAIPVDRKMESSLLSHKYFGGIQRDDLPVDGLPFGADRVRDHLQLVFLVCTGRQFDDLRQDLENQQGYVLAIKDDLVSASADLMLFSELKEFAEKDADMPASFVGAHPLVVEEETRQRLIAALRDARGGEDLTVPPSDQPDPQEGVNTEAPPIPDDLRAVMESEQFMILVVLRSADTVQP